MPYLKFDEWEISDAKEALDESNVSFESIGDNLDHELKIEAFLENIDNFTQAQFDEFLKGLKSK